MYKKSIRRFSARVRCAVGAIVVAMIGTGFRANPQAASNNPSFDVATIKRTIKDASHPFDPMHHGVHVSQTRASYWSMTLDSLVSYAYGVDLIQVSIPERANFDRFDIEAKFPEEADEKDDRRMLQALLKERFKLSFHTEKRKFVGYVLVVGKHGEKLRPTVRDAAGFAVNTPFTPGASSVGEEVDKSKIIKRPDGSSTIYMSKWGTQTVKFDQESSSQHWEVSKMTMEELAKRLGVCLGIGFHKVVDETGLKGDYQVAYDCPMPGPPLPGASDAGGMMPFDPEDGSLLTRSLDGLGLKLQKRQMLMDVYVIDHVDGPSEN